MAFNFSDFSSPVPAFKGPPQLSRLCEVAAFGNWRLAKRLSRPELCQDWGPRGLTPLMAALDAGARRPEDHAELEFTARALLDDSDPLQLSRDGKAASALMMAASLGWARVVEALLARSDPLALDACGATALMRAAGAGHPSCVELLKNFGPRAWDLEERTPLMLAAASGSGECVQTLLPLSDPWAFCSRGSRAAHWAARSGHADLALDLARAGGAGCEIDEAGQDLAMSALLEKRFETAARLATAESMRRRDDHGRHLLDRALAVAGTYDGKRALEEGGLRFLLNRLALGSDWLGQNGEPVRAAAEQGLSGPLAAAARAGSLFGRGEDGQTFLAIALRFGDEKTADRMFDELESRGGPQAPAPEVDIGQEMALAVGTKWLAWLAGLSNPRRRLLGDDERRRPTAALEAVARRREEDVPWVADARLDLEARGGADQSTALMEAARWGLERFVEALAPLARVGAKNGSGLDALWIAAAHGRERCVEILRSWTAASSLGCRVQAGKAIDLALSKRGDAWLGLLPLLDAMDLRGSQALERACRAGHEGLAVALEAAAAARGVELDWAAALARACEGFQPGMARMALRKAHPNARDAQGRDALIAAARAARSKRADLEAFEQISMAIALDPRCDISARDHRGRSAMEILTAPAKDLADCPELGAPHPEAGQLLAKALNARAERDALEACSVAPAPLSRATRL